MEGMATIFSSKMHIRQDIIAFPSRISNGNRFVEATFEALGRLGEAEMISHCPMEFETIAVHTKYRMPQCKLRYSIEMTNCLSS
jgi:hypothetical protein